MTPFFPSKKEKYVEKRVGASVKMDLEKRL
jgi:hypothetical protein